MSEKTRKAEQRRLRKAVGDDAMALMAAMSGILNESVFPLMQQHGEQLRELAQRLETLEGMVKALAKREMPSLTIRGEATVEVGSQPMRDEPPFIAQGVGFERVLSENGDLTIERVGAEVV